MTCSLLSFSPLITSVDSKCMLRNNSLLDLAGPDQRFVHLWEVEGHLFPAAATPLPNEKPMVFLKTVPQGCAEGAWTGVKSRSDEQDQLPAFPRRCTY